MGWVVYYVILTLAYIAASVYSFLHPHRLPDVIKSVSVLITLTTAMAQAIARVNLRFYLFWQRFWVWWHGDKTAIWRVSLRMDGALGPDPLARIKRALKGEMKNWESEIIATSDLSLRLKFEKVVQLYVQYDPRALSEDADDHLLVRSEELEVAYGRARQKIDRQITPLLSAFVNIVKPDSYSIVFEVLFPDKNPFFAFYVAHLRPEQVTQFQLVFRPHDFSRTNAEKVLVTRNALEVTAVTTEGFSEMAKAFILLTADAARVAQEA